MDGLLSFWHVLTTSIQNILEKWEVHWIVPWPRREFRDAFRIISWNFPHLGAGEKDVEKNNEQHRRLDLVGCNTSLSWGILFYLMSKPIGHLCDKWSGASWFLQHSNIWDCVLSPFLDLDICKVSGFSCQTIHVRYAHMLLILKVNVGTYVLHLVNNDIDLTVYAGMGIIFGHFRCEL